MLSALVFSGYQASAKPTWLRDVQPILQQYADLYPVMKPFIDLGDFGAVVRMRKLLRNVFAAPITDPNAMPVTRDLSAAKRAMLLAWLDRPRLHAHRDGRGSPGRRSRSPSSWSTRRSRRT